MHRRTQPLTHPPARPLTHLLTRRFALLRVAPLLAACLAVFAAGCQSGHEPGYPADPSPRPDQVMDFTTLYGQNCAACHGSNGQNGPAIDLANPEYQALIDDASLRKWIAGGMPGTEMPAFAQSSGGMLTDAQVDALVAGMRRQWRTQNVFAGAAPPAYAQTQAGDAHRGLQAYQARCAGCHKSGGEEITSSGYLSLVSDQALRSIMIAGRPDIGHPDWLHDASGGKPAAPLSAQDVDDMVTYLGTLRNAAPAAASAPSGR
jgi:cytochrome c oxidase cbb3-type subunit III